jgi:hypothetical protein
MGKGETMTLSSKVAYSIIKKIKWSMEILVIIMNVWLLPNEYDVIEYDS